MPSQCDAHRITSHSLAARGWSNHCWPDQELCEAGAGRLSDAPQNCHPLDRGAAAVGVNSCEKRFLSDAEIHFVPHLNFLLVVLKDSMLLSMLSKSPLGECGHCMVVTATRAQNRDRRVVASSSWRVDGSIPLLMIQVFLINPHSQWNLCSIA